VLPWRWKGDQPADDQRESDRGEISDAFHAQDC
jgi:hypothetical protein